MTENLENKRDALRRHNRAVHLFDHWMRDPYIVMASDGSYFLTATYTRGETWHDSGIPLWRSGDLAEWEGPEVIWRLRDSAWIEPRLEEAAPEVGRNIHLWAPEMLEIRGRWVIAHTTSVRCSNLLVASGAILEPPLDEPVGADFGYRHDPSLFIDADKGGTAWLVYGCASIIPLKPDCTGFAGDAIPVAPANRKMGHEGCVIRKIGGRYVLFGTAWSTDRMRHGTYNLYYCTADRVEGPYGERRFAGRCCGHGTPFLDKEGRWWCTAFANGEFVEPSDPALADPNPQRALTINRQGLTLVPLEVGSGADGDVRVRARDPAYASPGPEEVHDFGL